MEARGNFAARGLTAGNQLRRWHGTNRNCNIGDNGRTTICYSSRCSLCCIIKSSFDLTYSKKKTGWGRFGNGIYTSSTSSKFVGYSLITNHSLPDSCCLQVKRLQHEPRVFSVEGRLTLLRRGRKMQEAHNGSTYPLRGLIQCGRNHHPRFL